MPYIPLIDEIFVAPPYDLDTYAVPFESNVFVLPAKRKKLQKLVDEQLNAVMPNGPFVYTVPLTVQALFIAFFRYGRVQSTVELGKGWLGYNEAMIGFLVERRPHPCLPPDHPAWKVPTEFVTYLGVVYIGDRSANGPVDDPYAIPIVLGRAAYGLPKNPGRVSYDPLDSHVPNGPKVEVWDYAPGGGHLHLSDAIRISPIHPSSLVPRAILPPDAPPRPPNDFPIPDEAFGKIDRRSPEGRRREAVLRDWNLFAQLLGVPADELQLESAVGVVDDPNAVLATVPGEDVKPVAWLNLLWRSKLVGLKQVPDPKTSAPAGGGFAEAYYQAIVESPLEETPDHLLGPRDFIYWDQRVEFPKLERVNLIKRFGIKTTGPREVEVGKDAMFYQEGSLLYADPEKVNVWKPI